MHRVFLQHCCSCVVKCLNKQYWPKNPPSIYLQVSSQPPSSWWYSTTLILLKNRRDSSTDAACLLPNGIIHLIPCSQIRRLLRKIITMVVTLKGVGGWRVGEKKNGRDRECVLHTACHHPLLMAQNSVFMLTVIEYFCSLVFKSYTQKSGSPTAWDRDCRICLQFCCVGNGDGAASSMESCGI